MATRHASSSHSRHTWPSILQRFLIMALIRWYTINMPWFYIAPGLLLAFIKAFCYVQLVRSYACSFPGLKPNDQKDADAWGIYPRCKKSLRSAIQLLFLNMVPCFFQIPPQKKGGTPQWANLAAFGNTEGVANNDGQWCIAPWCNYFQHCSGISTMDWIFELLEEVSRGALSVMMGDGVAQGPLVARLTRMKVQPFLETCCCLSRGFASGWVVQDGLGQCQWLMCKSSWPVGISESEHMNRKVLTSTLLFPDDCHKNITKRQQFNYITYEFK